MPYLFNEAHKQLQQLFFAINLHVSTDPVIENEVKELFRVLRTAFSKEFGKATYHYEQSTKSGIIVASQNHRQIVVSPFTLQYIERKRFNKRTFNEVCKSLYEFYVKEKQINLQDIKLIGKVFDYIFDIGQESIELLKEKTGLFQDSELSTFNIKATVVEQEKNIHLYINTLEKSDDEESGEKANNLLIKLDINNREQISGIKENSFDDIITFADEYAKDKLIPLLNKYLG